MANKGSNFAAFVRLRPHTYARTQQLDKIGSKAEPLGTPISNEATETVGTANLIAVILVCKGLF